MSLIEGTKRKRLQVAVDFMSSYGVAILIMAIAISIAYILSSGITNAFAPECTPSPGFSCGYFSMANNGSLIIQISQATGSAITVNGIACSTLQGLNGLPKYGNRYVNSNSIYYPDGFSPSANIPSGGSFTFFLYCYGPKGISRFSKAGSTFVGYIWMNYTLYNTKINATQQIASIQLQTTG
jgi:hypothetical protein